MLAGVSEGALVEPVVERAAAGGERYAGNAVGPEGCQWCRGLHRQRLPHSAA